MLDLPLREIIQDGIRSITDPIALRISVGSMTDCLHVGRELGVEPASANASEAFVLSCVDGCTMIVDLLSISPMDELETLQSISALLAVGMVKARPEPLLCVPTRPFWSGDGGKLALLDSPLKRLQILHSVRAASVRTRLALRSPSSRLLLHQARRFSPGALEGIFSQSRSGTGARSLEEKESALHEKETPDSEAVALNRRARQELSDARRQQKERPLDGEGTTDLRAVEKATSNDAQ